VHSIKFCECSGQLRCTEIFRTMENEPRSSTMWSFSRRFMSVLHSCVDIDVPYDRIWRGNNI
jgi:hypothetical protein